MEHDALTPQALLRSNSIGNMTIAIFTLGIFITANAHGDSVSIETLKTHSRLTILIDSNLTVQKQLSQAGFELFMDGATLADLGVPAGEEAAWKTQFRKINDPRLASLKFTQGPVTWDGGKHSGLKISGTWKFPAGSQALANPAMEWFDYRKSFPAQFIVDFWHKKGATVNEIRAKLRKDKLLAQLKQEKEEIQKRADRKLAKEKAKAEAEDVGRFCQVPLSENTDLFVPFLPYHEKIDFSVWFASKTPDAQFHYLLPTAKTKEAQYIRLALKLYEQGDPGLTIRTLDFFDQEFPDSVYRYDMRFLRANAMIKLNFRKPAQLILKQLMSESRESPGALYSAMYLAGHQIASGSYHEALENFMWLNSNYPGHRLDWVFHLGAAEALFMLKETERAAKEYEWIIENAQDDSAKAKAALRIGDLYLTHSFNERALASYYQGIRYFSEEAKNFPAVHINRAEALYQIGDYEAAHKAFDEFLSKFSAHPAGWRATFRLGEIHARQQSEAGRREGRTWYQETINRYPTSPGAMLARLRLVPCGDHGGLSEDAALRFFSNEAEQFNTRGEFQVTPYRDLRSLTKVRHLVITGKDSEAVVSAIAEIKQSPTSKARPFLAHIAATLFRKHILDLLRAGGKYEALAFYSEKKPFLPHDGIPAESDYLVSLSRAASDLGFGNLASTFITNTRSPASVPSSNDNNLEDVVIEAEKAFTQAQALWVASGTEASQQIRKLLASVPEESSFSFGREVLLGLLDEREDNPTSALKHAIGAQLLVPKNDFSSYLNFQAWLASLHTKVGSSKIAIDIYRNLAKALENNEAMKNVKGIPYLELPPVPPLESVLLTLGGLLEKAGQWGDAASVYARAIDAKLGGNHALYSYASSLAKTGKAADLEKAKEATNKLINSKEDDFWKRLAEENLNAQKAIFGGIQ